MKQLEVLKVENMWEEVDQRVIEFIEDLIVRGE